MNKTTSYTITCHRPLNYGAVLQAYALNTKLVSLGLDAKVIDYCPPYYYQSGKSLPIRVARTIFRMLDWIMGRRSFGKFLHENIPLSPISYKNIADIERETPVADIYIAGSDQIWNCMELENGKDDSFFLTFARHGAKKISYAASLAMPEIPGAQIERYKKNLSSFDAISVRESTGKKLLTDIGIADVKTVLDPVFLLRQEDWECICRKSSFIPKERYILIYSFMRNKAIHKYARQLAREMGVKVYSINTTIEDHLLDTDKYFWNASPNTFINLIKNSEAVVTNSFHGTSFSIIFNKPFHLFGKKDKANSRMLDLLNDLNLLDRIVKDETPIENTIDYTKVNETIEKKREASLSFLRDSIFGAHHEN